VVTLRTILDTCSNFHTSRQEFERANRNAAYFNHCNSEDGKCELHVHSFAIFAPVWLQLCQLIRFFQLGTRLTQTCLWHSPSTPCNSHSQRHSPDDSPTAVALRSGSLPDTSCIKWQHSAHTVTLRMWENRFRRLLL